MSFVPFSHVPYLSLLRLGLTRDLEHAHGVEEDVIHKLRKQVKKVEDEKEQLRTQVALAAQREADVEGTLHIVRTHPVKHCRIYTFLLQYKRVVWKENARSIRVIPSHT